MPPEVGTFGEHKGFFEARVEDMSAADRLRIECTCGRIALISVAGLGLPPYLRVLELKRRLMCENCGERGKVDLSIVWADSSP
jgi:hypothetical protein